jgi:cell division protein FtsI/penicillin-binding protein 2
MNKSRIIFKRGVIDTPKDYLVLGYVFIFSIYLLFSIFQLILSPKPSVGVLSENDSNDRFQKNNIVLPTIYDSNNISLTKNVSVYKIIYDNTQLPKEKDLEVLTRFDQLAGSETVKNKFEYFEQSEFRHNDIVIFETVDKNIVSKLITSDISKYLLIQEYINRDYVFPVQLSNIIGYTNQNSSTGLENYLEYKFKNVSVQTVNLTIDSKLQNLVYDEFSKTLTNNNLKSGVAVFSKENGDILSNVSIPSFDANVFTKLENDKINLTLQDTGKPLLNRLYDLIFPSGSILKLSTSVAALETKKIDKASIINSEGCMELSTGVKFCEYTKLPYGNLNIVNALRLSSNIFFCKLFTQNGLTIDELNSYQEMLGLGNSSGLEVINEQVGSVASPDFKKLFTDEPWFLGDTCNSAIGQGYTQVSPAQMLRMTNIFSTFGTDNGLRIISHVIDKNGSFLKSVGINKKLSISKSTFEIIKEGMRESAKINGLDKYLVYSKTGTAEIGDGISPHTWLIGYYESEKLGKISFVVFIENGGTTKLNIAFLNSLFNRFENSELKEYAANKQ